MMEEELEAATVAVHYFVAPGYYYIDEVPDVYYAVAVPVLAPPHLPFVFVAVWKVVAEVVEIVTRFYCKVHDFESTMIWLWWER